MKVCYLVCGGRDFADRVPLEHELYKRPVGAIVHGGARGADRMAGDWARKNGIPEIRIDANWDFYAKKAGPIRNGWMLEFVRVDVVLAFPGGSGTANMVAKARKAGIPVKEIGVGPITSFKKEYDFLSNFFPVEVTFDGLTYPSVEHAYVAAKSLDPDFRRVVCKAPSAGAAKKLGRKVKLRPCWGHLKLEVMERLLRRKFEHLHLRERLWDTAPRELAEGNTWGDQFWGVCNGVGENHLGKLLMKIRDK